VSLFSWEHELPFVKKLDMAWQPTVKHMNRFAIKILFSAFVASIKNEKDVKKCERLMGKKKIPGLCPLIKRR